MLEQILELDKQVFLFLNNLGNPSWDGFWMFYTDKLHWIPFYAVLFFFMYKKRNDKSIILTAVVIALMILFTDQITNLFKYGLKRPRPCHEADLIDVMRLVKSWCGGAYGYFSGHASNSMAVAIFSGFMLKQRFKYLIYILIVWSLAMGYSRIYIGVHYPLDVLSGMIFGGFSGYMFYRFESYLHKRFTLR